MRVFVSWLTLVLLCASSCMRRVAIPAPPPPSAPLQERQRAFQTLAPVSQQQTVVVSPYGYALANRTDFVLLQGGWRIEHPSDLLPAVPAQSPVVQYAKSYEASAATASALTWTGGVLATLGVGVSFVGLSSQARSSTGRYDPTFVYAGLAAAVVGSLVMAGAFFPMMQAEQDRSSAFLLYPTALRERLGLDAEAPQEAPPPPAAPVPGQVSPTSISAALLSRP